MPRKLTNGALWVITKIFIINEIITRCQNCMQDPHIIMHSLKQYEYKCSTSLLNMIFAIIITITLFIGKIKISHFLPVLELD